jgi:uncharacterized protein YycO
MSKILQWRLVTADDVVSDCIRFISRGQVSHVEFITLDGTQTIGAHLDGGVAIRTLEKCSVDYRFQAQCTDEQYADATDFLFRQIGKPYDLTNIAGILLNRDWHNNSSWICSELWAATLEAGKLIGELGTTINAFTPNDSLIVSLAMFGSVLG